MVRVTAGPPIILAPVLPRDSKAIVFAPFPRLRVTDFWGVSVSRASVWGACQTRARSQSKVSGSSATTGALVPAIRAVAICRTRNACTDILVCSWLERVIPIEMGPQNFSYPEHSGNISPERLTGPEACDCRPNVRDCIKHGGGH